MRLRRVALVLLGLLAIALAALSPLREFALGAAVGVLGTLLVPRVARRRRDAPVETGLSPLLRELEARGWAVSLDEQIIVGPPGAYLLETRTLTGAVSLADGSLVVRRGDDEAWKMSASTESRLRAGAKEARRVLGAANLHWVRPVVVLWCEFPALLAEHGGVTYVHADRLVSWLAGLPATVSPQSLESARSCLRRLDADATRTAA